MTTWKAIYADLNKGGNTTKGWILDNEASLPLKQALKQNNQSYQLTPPHIHRINAAERAIRTWKNHFLSTLATCDDAYPINEWDRLIPHVNLTLNLLRNARANPKLSAHAFLNGTFDFNRTPICPAGTKVIVHSKPDNRPSWAYHGREGWTIGTSPEHYRCIK